LIAIPQKQNIIKSWKPVLEKNCWREDFGRNWLKGGLASHLSKLIKQKPIKYWQISWINQFFQAICIS